MVNRITVLTPRWREKDYKFRKKNREFKVSSLKDVDNFCKRL